MRKVILLVLYIFFLFLSFGHAFTVAINGKIWNELDKEAKVNYLVGYRDGESAGLTSTTLYTSKTTQTLKAEEQIIQRHNILEKSDIQQILSGIDKFYSDYANVELPITIAIYIVVERMQGVPEEIIQKIIEDYRKDIIQIKLDEK